MDMPVAADHVVRHFREILLWPLQLLPLSDERAGQPHWLLLERGDVAGDGVHNAYLAEWLAADGAVLAASDTGCRSKFLQFACRHRTPATSAHCAFLRFTHRYWFHVLSDDRLPVRVRLAQITALGARGDQRP